ncbi:MAG: SAM-dependent methyltransferase [Blastocatellia bacterium]
MACRSVCRVGVQPGQRIADIGSGSGYFTFRLAARVGAEGKVKAVEIDEKAIRKKNRAHKAGCNPFAPDRPLFGGCLLWKFVSR